MTEKESAMFADDGDVYRVQQVEVTSALIADDKGFALWCESFLRPYLLEGKAVAIKVHQSDVRTSGD